MLAERMLDELIKDMPDTSIRYVYFFGEKACRVFTCCHQRSYLVSQ